MDVTDILKTCGPNAAGTGTEILFAKKSTFTAIAAATPYDTATTPDELVTIAGDHTFAGTDGFRKLQITDRTGKVDSTSVGEIDGKSFEHSFTGNVPGSDAENLGNLSLLAYCEWIFLVPEESASGVIYRQIGTEQHAAYVETDNFTTDVTGGSKKTEFMIKSVGHSTHAPEYQGVITMAS